MHAAVPAAAFPNEPFDLLKVEVEDEVKVEQVNVNVNVNLEPDLPWLSRSPHPYHRNSRELQQPSELFLRPRPSAVPLSDSGTEADDEHFLKGLPAPRAKPHKGLRGSVNELMSGLSSGLSTPFLTPSHLHGNIDTDVSSIGIGGDDGDGDGKPSQAVAAVADVKDPLVREDHPPHHRASADRHRRRRREIVRRSTELTLLVFLGGLLFSHPHVRPLLRRWRRELQATLAVVTGVVALYPLRVVLWGYRQRKNRPTECASGLSGLSSLLYIPSAFDPAPLLYPLAIPVFVSLLLATPTLPAAPLLNLILAICAIPRSLIPLALRGELCASVQWVLSCVPAMVCQARSDDAAPFPAPISPETATLLYPLHQTLCWLLHSLTTTSLLPAELQLLSTGLINLLVLAASPQAVILQAVLWGGGLGILITSSTAIRWGITLARVPRWRFRRESAGTSTATVFSAARAVVRWVVTELSMTRRARLETMFGRTAATNWDDSDAYDDAAPGPSDSDEGPSRSRRSLSFKPETAVGVGVGALKTHTPSGRRKRAASSSVRAFFSLTHAQATRRKWMYAGYVYACMVAIIMGPIRLYVAEHALQGREPFGWALGYLLGDLWSFRLEVVKANLEYWVCLPARTSLAVLSPLSSAAPPPFELVRQWLGVANTRLMLMAYWAGIIAVGLAVVLQLSPVCEVDTRRKVFHFMMVAMLLPATFVDPAYAALALSLVLAVFLLVDLLRASQLPPLSRPIANFLTPYVDGRDLRGPVVISHIFLLIGCAIPLWLSLAALPRGPITASEDKDTCCSHRWELPTRDVSMVAGVVCVGLGDAAASLIGRRWGRRKWLWGGGKSLEGSVAFATAVFLGLVAASAWMRLGRWPMTTATATVTPTTAASSVAAVVPPTTSAMIWRATETVPRAGVCATVASLTEAVLTGGNDNVVVPVILWTCVKSLGL